MKGWSRQPGCGRAPPCAGGRLTAPCFPFLPLPTQNGETSPEAPAEDAASANGVEQLGAEATAVNIVFAEQARDPGGRGAARRGSRGREAVVAPATCALQSSRSGAAIPMVAGGSHSPNVTLRTRPS